MTERGLPIVDGAPACPFVAFDDDRDERAASPDHRHRCYAEPKPAPRALAHQEAYCLSSAFPVCPTFQDWARREAARSRAEPPRSVDSISALAAAPPSQRNPPRNWAAPPPWSNRGDAARGQEQLWEPDPEGDDDVVTADPAIPTRGQGLSGSFADRVASGPGGADAADAAGAAGAAALGAAGLAGSAGAGAGDDDSAATVPPAAPPAPAYTPPAPPYAPPPYVPPEPPYAPPEAAVTPPPTRAPEPDQWDDGLEDGLEDDVEPAPEPAPRRRRERDLPGVAALGGGPRGGSGGGAPDRPRERRRDANAPEWERARPMEAYPTLRSRRLSELSVPPILVGAVALALAAAVLFALPGLLGFGNPSAGGSPTPTTPLVTPIVTPGPTPIAQPTEQIYIVQAGDTMSRIAGRFDLTLEQLIAANAENIPDPNKLQIGDQVIIPARTPGEIPAGSEIPGAS